MLIWRLESEHGAVYRSRPLIDSHSQTELSLQVIHGEHVDVYMTCALWPSLMEKGRFFVSGWKEFEHVSL
jgi:hypothetical protein